MCSRAVTDGGCRAASSEWPTRRSSRAAAPSGGHFNCRVRVPERNGTNSTMTLERLLACALAPAQGCRRAIWRAIWRTGIWPPGIWPPGVRALTGTCRLVWSGIGHLPLRAHETVPRATSAWRATSEILTKVLPKCLSDRNASIRLDARRGWRSAQRDGVDTFREQPSQPGRAAGGSRPGRDGAAVATGGCRPAATCRASQRLLRRSAAIRGCYLVMRPDGRGGLFRAGSDACRAVRLAAGRRPDRLAESGADLECQVQTAPAALGSPLPPV